MEIVGVVADVKYLGLATGPLPIYYESDTQPQPRWRSLVVRTSTPAASLIQSVTREIGAIDRNVVITRARSMDELLFQSVTQPRFRTQLIGGFAMLALVLAAIGIYGVVAYSVERRTQEIGIRLALGARRVDVLRLIVGHGAWMGALGIFFGLFGAIGFTRLLRGFLFQVSAGDPITFALMGVLLLAVVLGASIIPARRALRVDPAVTLRAE